MINNKLCCLVVTLVLGGCASTGSDKDSNNTLTRQQSMVNTSLGREYMNRGQFEIALEKLKKAVNADPEYAPAHTVLAVLYEQIREPELAEQHYRKALKITPENGDVNNNFGVFLCQAGREDDAEKYFLKATDDPFYRTPAVAYANAGTCKLQSGNLDKAESYLRQSLEYDAKFADALIALAKVSFMKGENFAARAFLQRYESVGPISAESLSLGFQVESSLNNGAAARKYADQLTMQFPESDQAKGIKSEP